MKINQMLRAIGSLVAEREIIDHGSIRCLHSEDAVRGIVQGEGIDDDDVETGVIGDDGLAEWFTDLAEDADRIAEIDMDALLDLNNVFLGEALDNYITPDAEDGLVDLDTLIDAAMEFLRSA